MRFSPPVAGRIAGLYTVRNPLFKVGIFCIKSKYVKYNKIPKKITNSIDNREIILYNERVRWLTYNILYEGAVKKWQ